MNLEQEIINQVRSGIGEAIAKTIGGYNTPLEKLIRQVIDNHGDVIKSLVEEAFSSALSGELRTSLKQALSHKIAKLMVSKMEGEIEKRVNDLRSNPATRGYIIVAVEKAISEIGKE